MEKIIRNSWRRESGNPFESAQILRHEIHPEGLDVDRLRFLETGKMVLGAGVGRIISVLRGNARLHMAGAEGKPLQLGPGVHLYIPADVESVLEAEPAAELLRVSGPSASQAQW